MCHHFNHGVCCAVLSEQTISMSVDYYVQIMKYVYPGE